MRANLPDSEDSHRESWSEYQLKRVKRDGDDEFQHKQHQTCAAITRKTIFLLVSCCSPQSKTSSRI